MFSVHTTARAGIQNTTITVYFGFFFDENLVWEIIVTPFSKTSGFKNVKKTKAGISFNFRFEKRFGKVSFRDRLVLMVSLTVDVFKVLRRSEDAALAALRLVSTSA